MGRRTHVNVIDNTKIQLHIYVLGCYPQGEAVFIVVWDDSSKNVLQSILIDFYSIDKFEPIFKQYGVDKSKLNFIIWTHPDKDHSEGLARVINYYTSRETYYLLPDGLTLSYIIKHTNNVALKSYIALTSNRIIKRIANIEHVNNSRKRLYPEIYGALVFKDGYHDEVNMDIEILTPIAGLAFKHTEINQSHIGNDISISVLIRLGGQGFYFGGDAMNPAISEIDIERLTNIVFIKIPHHASKTSDILPQMLGKLMIEGFMYKATSVSTSFVVGASNLPEKDVLNKYKQVSDNILLTEDNIHANKYGIWNCNYNIKPYQLIQIKSEGDASVWF